MVELLDGRLGRLCDLLVAEFVGRLDEEAVWEEVARAERELRGQVPAGAVDELTHRVAAHRLALRCAEIGPFDPARPVGSVSEDSV